jgi:NAD(P)-dependent dehydrogenase (short-subunit alcohol dehydrogenase family)
MEKKVAIITGATGGMGAVTAEAIAKQGFVTILVGRSRQKGLEVLEVIKKKTQNPDVFFMLTDLSSQQSIRELVIVFKSKYNRLDLLVNNVGAVFSKRITTVDGIEMTFALNHLSYFLLTNLLLDILKSSNPGRIVNISSATHSGVKEKNIEDWQGQKKYSMIQAYHRSKLANLLFTYELDRRLKGSGVTVNAVKPGFTKSELGKNAGGFISIILRLMSVLMTKSTEEGAETAIYLSTSNEVDGISGKYYDKKNQITSSKSSYDTKLALQLWNLSEKLTKLN